GAGKKFLFKRVSDTYSEKTIASANMPKGFDVNAPHTVTVEVSGNTHTAYVDGVEVLSVTDDTYESGMVGLRKWDVSNPEAEVLFEDLVVEALP
ncbi:MAG: hypothetical protein U9R40_02255, partial [Synergistota bacterium]|nr:hypothetical protein [Synergistota bacterium]